MAKGRKRPASAIEEDQSSTLTNGAATTSAGGDDGGSKALANSASTSSEIKFGKHLASSDKRVRDRTVAALREWLRQRSRGGSLTDLDLLKIWRGLWYCMFMCDKAPVQRELAENLAGLLGLFKDDRPEGVRFFRSFCVTMQRDWERIDNLRIDKYYTLVRVFVREALAFCRVPAGAPSPAAHSKKKKKKQQNGGGGEEGGERAAAQWDLGLLGEISGIMEDEVLTLHPAPIGLRLHLADVWAAEACNAGGEDMPTEAFLVALAPWLRVAAHPETNAVVFKRTFEGIFEELLDYFPKEEGDGMEQEGEVEQAAEREKKVFKTVELDQVQACLFEVAAAPQTREKRRVQLYDLHRRYQKRTGVAPDASAPPSGILPVPEDSDSDSDPDGEDGEYEGEYVEAGARPRAVRGPEPAVPGWVAAGIAAGAISGDGGGDGGKNTKKRRKRSGSMEVEEEKVEPADGEGGRDREKRKKKRKSGDGLEEEAATATAGQEQGQEQAAVEEEEEGAGSAKKKKKKRSRESIETGGGEEAAAEPEAEADAVASPASTKKSKKRKKEEASLADGAGRAAEAEGPPTANGDGAMLSSPPSSGKRKSKKKRRESADGAATGADSTASEADAAAAVPAAVAEVPTPPSSGKKKKKKGKGKSEDAEEEAATPPAATPETAESATPESSSDKKKRKKKNKGSPSADGAAASPASLTDAAAAAMPPPEGSFRTPPKKGGKKANGGGGGSSGKAAKHRSTPGTTDSAKKTVTFAPKNMEKDHRASVKDLKTRVITPAKDAGTPQKGLLKVGGCGGSGMKPMMKPTAGRKDTPYASKKKKAADFFD